MRNQIAMPLAAAALLTMSADFFPPEPRYREADRPKRANPKRAKQKAQRKARLATKRSR